MAYKIGDSIVVGNDSSSHLQTDIVAYKYKTVLAYGYVAGGYKGSEAWKDVGKTTNATDQTVHLGALLAGASAYNSAASNLYTMFVFGTHGDDDRGWESGTVDLGAGSIDVGWGVAGHFVEGINMINESLRTHTTNWDMADIRNNMGISFLEHYFCWIYGGRASTTILKFDLTNEAMLSATYTLPWLPVVDSNRYTISSMNDQYQSYIYADSESTKYNMASETFTTAAAQWGPHGQQMAINSKDHRGWCGNEGSYAGGYNYREWNLITDSLVSTFAKVTPGPSGPGEENYTMGQDHCYMLGNHDGNQNNNSVRFTYATNTQVANPVGLAPSWQGGMSSAACGWRA